MRLDDRPGAGSESTGVVHVAVRIGPWKAGGAIQNLVGSTAAVFGTFNETRAAGRLERLLTPIEARSITVTLKRRFGGGPAVRTPGND